MNFVEGAAVLGGDYPELLSEELQGLFSLALILENVLQKSLGHAGEHSA